MKENNSYLARIVRLEANVTDIQNFLLSQFGGKSNLGMNIKGEVHERFDHLDEKIRGMMKISIAVFLLLVSMAITIGSTFIYQEFYAEERPIQEERQP